MRSLRRAGSEQPASQTIAAIGDGADGSDIRVSIISANLMYQAGTVVWENNKYCDHGEIKPLPDHVDKLARPYRLTYYAQAVVAAAFAKLPEPELPHGLTAEDRERVLKALADKGLLPAQRRCHE